MEKDYSPFSPGRPVEAELFVGREAEVKRLMENVRTSTSGRVEVSFLGGERGIGKSSLASIVNMIAQRQHEVLGLHVYLGGVTTLSEMTRRIFEGLLQESVAESWYGKIKGFFGKSVRQVGLFGVSVTFDAPQRDLEAAVRGFAPALQRLMSDLGDSRKGILLILDDINGLSESKDFANWLKSFVDEAATSKKRLPLSLILVGLEERKQALCNLQPSLARVFDPIDIRIWEDVETQRFFDQAFKRVGVKCDSRALPVLSGYTGGLPVLAHEIGDAVFRVDDNDEISVQDTAQGIVLAADIVGKKYLRPKVLQAIRSERYKQILLKLANSPDFYFRRQDAIQGLGGDEEKTFDKFVKRMIDLGVIVKGPERGTYHFSNRLHWLFFALEAGSVSGKSFLSQ